MTPPVTPPMTPERWRVVDSVLQGALASGPGRRDAFVREACGEDLALRREVESLLAAHDAAGDDFLESPPPGVEALAEPGAPNGAGGSPDAERLAAALAGRYAVEREVARGGMATVYLARDLKHGRRVALKVLHPGLAAALGAERFLEEIRVTAALQHPHVLPLFDSGDAGGLLWYAMPFVDGETLRARLAREGRLPVGEAVRLAREVADALDHAHARGVVHRDVKPENVLLQGGHALVADFGIALALEQAGGERLTRTGLTLGTPEYMAPEQAAGERALDARVDVYALGVVLHEPPTALAARRPEVPRPVDAAVLRALEKRPEARFASASAFASALDAALEAALAAPRAGAAAPNEHGGARGAGGAGAPPPGRTVRARAAMYAVAVTLVAGLVGGWALARSSAMEQLANAPQSLVPTVSAPILAPSPGGDASGLSLVVVDRAGRPQRAIAAERPWTPRFSPDGRRVAYGAFGSGRQTSDVWVMDLAAGTTKRLTDDDGDSNDPQWSPDGAAVAYSVSATGGKDLAARRLAGGAPRSLASRDGTQFASDWLRDGSALLVTEDAGNQRDVVVQPADGSPARPYAATDADELAARVSPDGRWVAYTSDASGRAEVYLDAYPRPGRRVLLSRGGGVHPVWRGDGRELYYWRDGALVAVKLENAKGDAPPAPLGERELFRAPYAGGLNTMYDASPDGARFVIVRHR